MLKKAGHARSDYKQTFIKQLTFCKLVKPLLGFSNLVIEKSTVSVNLSKMSFLTLTRLLSFCLTMICLLKFPFFLFFFSIRQPKSMLSQSFASLVGSNGLTIATFTLSFFSSMGFGSTAFCSSAASVLTSSTFAKTFSEGSTFASTFSKV
jgi:hypothetical protein